MTKILVISDTHGYVNPIIDLINIENPDLILHAGDYCINKNELINLNCIFVDGNNDYQGNDMKLINVENKKILLIHGHRQWKINKEKWHNNLRELGKRYKSNIVIYGHSHSPIIDESSFPIVFNPGSLIFPRGNYRSKSYGIIWINDNDIKCEIKFISS